MYGQEQLGNQGQPENHQQSQHQASGQLQYQEQLQQLLPAEIEKRSFEIITAELGGRVLDRWQEPVIKRVIHTSADFEYADTLCFSDQAVQIGLQAIRNGIPIVTDTQMGRAGINKKRFAEYGGEVFCYMADQDVAETAAAEQVTRAAVSMRKAAECHPKYILAVGNAPTALLEVERLIRMGLAAPQLIIGVPVGFVNVIPAKELIMAAGVPYIVARGRKGGSNVAAAICNALIYMADQEAFSI